MRGGLPSRPLCRCRIVMLSIALLLGSSGQVQLPKGSSGDGGRRCQKAADNRSTVVQEATSKESRGSRNRAPEDATYTGRDVVETSILAFSLHFHCNLPSQRSLDFKSIFCKLSRCN